VLKKLYPWLLWVAVAGWVGGYLALALRSDDQRVFLPGETTHAHHQIELACEVCHTDDFQGVKNDACNACHAEELKRANDSHPSKKFTDPRNADRVKILDARDCMTCHREHQPEITRTMAVTLPMDYCAYCHQDIAQERPSHEGMGFDTCATAGCHNFHDNTALYEDFLLKHLDEADFAEHPVLPARDGYAEELAEKAPTPLTATDRDVPPSVSFDQQMVFDWATTAHARAGVNCTDCHGGKTGTAAWVENPGFESCKECHDREVAGFLGGKHGMRLAQDLSPMKPGMARIPMHEDAAHRELSCVSCHTDHRFDTRTAAVDACMACHADEHTRNYVNSPHYELWQKEVSGIAEPGTGVSCATCHMPRITVDDFGVKRTLVQHNQNDTLRPNEKMIRPACLHCHGLQFSIDALADPELIRSNFDVSPQLQIESLEMSRKRVEP
jgi:hypothetical protein